MTEFERKAAAPNFLVIGAMKSGTTTLWEMLGRAEGLHVSPTKEPDVFSSDEYSEEFALGQFSSLFRGAKGGERVGECSTSYTKHSLSSVSAVRARRLCGPDLRLVYCVRNPVDRLVSHFRHLNAVGKSGPILADELARGHGLIENGLYSECIAPWVEEFGSDQLLVVDFDDVAGANATLLGAVAAHCGATASAPLSVGVPLNGASAFKPRKGSLLYKVNRSGPYQRFRNLVPAGVRRAALEAAGSLDRRVAPRPTPVLRLSPQLVGEVVALYEADLRDFSVSYPFVASWDIRQTANRVLG